MSKAMNLLKRQAEIKSKIIDFSKLFGIDPFWAVAVAMTESSLGVNQLSSTGCKGVFQLSSIAMKDLLQEMSKVDDDLIDIACGISFFYLLMKRWKSIEEATAHYCDPNDKERYLEKVLLYKKIFEGELNGSGSEGQA